MAQVSLPVFVLLLCVIQAVVVVNANSGDNWIRKRRHWVIPPRKLDENEDYTHLQYVSKIRSDHETDLDIEYSLEGIGANQEPFNVFVVDSRTGLIRVTKILDREEIAMYNLSGIARSKSGKMVEKKIDLRIKVIDVNDNSPVFTASEAGEVKELSAIGTSVMKITATDADEPGNVNSQIAYSIVEQKPSHGMFSIQEDGTVYVQGRALDRETTDEYTLTVKGQDLNGEPGGKTGTGTVVIKILDVNDNLPTLEKDQYEVSINENTHGVEVMRFQAHDLDLEGTDSWIAVFQIMKGNEAGYFSFKVDNKTNEGILMLDKAVDYEDVKNLELKVALRNKAEQYSAALVPSPQQRKIYGIKVNVMNQPEGPVFDPKVKSIRVSEGDKTIKINEVIARYPAKDADTMQEAENVRYYKGSDPDNWLTIDPKTAEIKLNKMPDRESSFLKNGTYFAKVLCISKDMPDTTATGTIAIQVKDSNDNCPTLTSDRQTMCTTSNSVVVNAKDEDFYPNGPPFSFTIIPEGTVGKWKVERLNDTAAILRAEEDMWPELYDVNLLVKDMQGHHCEESQKLKVRVCTCENGVVCGKIGANGEPSKGADFGPAGIGVLFLGLLLLLLFLLLLFVCKCGPVFRKNPFDPKPHLINYHTEGQGENTDLPLVKLPTQVGGQYIKDGLGIDNTTSFQQIIDTMKKTNHQDHTSLYIDGMNGTSYQDVSISCHRDSAFGSNQDNGSGFCSTIRSNKSSFGGGLYDDMSLPDHFLREYYTQKVASENEKFEMEDNHLVYDFEGQGSPAGSVGCCSLLESDNDLHFLYDLGPKFKTLAEVCGGKKMSTEVKQVLSHLPSTSINTHNTQPTVHKLEQTVVRETSEHSQMVKDSTVTVMEGMTTINKGMTNQGQMLLLQQQPVYYTTSSVLQPMQYVVQPQAHNTMLLAEAPATNLQDMVLVNGTQTGSAQGVFQGSSANLIHAGNLTGSQTMVVVEGGVPTGSVKVMNGNQTSILRGVHNKQ